MSTKKLTKDLYQFLCNGGGVIRNGNYHIEEHHFLKATEHFLKTGENQLHTLDIIIHATWKEDDYYSQSIYSEETIKVLEALLSGELFWQVDDFDIEEIAIITQELERSTAVTDALQSYPHRRKQSLRKNQKVRAELLEKYNYKCVQCGSEESLHVDHIIPVRCGGSDDINNLQILCQSCNSSKGSKIIKGGDYD